MTEITPDGADNFDDWEQIKITIDGQHYIRFRFGIQICYQEIIRGGVMVALLSGRPDTESCVGQANRILHTRDLPTMTDAQVKELDAFIAGRTDAQ